MPKKILIIDDDPVIVKYLTAVFEDNGYETCHANSSTEGLDVVKKVNPDLITLDLQMPDEWGPRFYRKLTKDKQYKEIPVIVITGVSGSKHSVPKAAAHFNKPFEPDKLILKVKEIFAKIDNPQIDNQ